MRQAKNYRLQVLCFIHRLSIIMASSLTFAEYVSKGNTRRLREVFHEGIEMHTKGMFEKAIELYSCCLNLALRQLGFNPEPGHKLQVTALHKFTTMDKDFRRIVESAYNNRSLASVQVRDYDQAFFDADSCLLTNPTDFRSLTCKGLAADGLQLYEKASEAYKSALVEFPGNPYLLKKFRESAKALEQSQTGNYALTDFLSSGCRIKIQYPDFVGPVEIRCRDHPVSGRRWGLFATKKLKPGELLLVSNPMVFCRMSVGRSIKYPETLTMRNELQKSILGCKRDMARIDALASSRDNPQMAIPSMELFTRIASGIPSGGKPPGPASSRDSPQLAIPSMELFRPGSEWIPPGAENLQCPDAISLDRIIEQNTFRYLEVEGMFEEKGTELMGLWVLPAFANHSCAPNCQHSLVGQTLFLRAARKLREGQELTLPYFTSHLLENVARRQACCERRHFRCKCERCRFEENLHEQLKNVINQTVTLNLPDAAILKAYTGAYTVTNPVEAGSALDDLIGVREEVERIIRSLGTKLNVQQQGWIRAAFFSSYWASASGILGVRLSYDREHLGLILDSMSSVYIMPQTLHLAAGLELQADIQFDAKTRDQVNRIYRIYWGIMA